MELDPLPARAPPVGSPGAPCSHSPPPNRDRGTPAPGRLDRFPLLRVNVREAFRPWLVGTILLGRPRRAASWPARGSFAAMQPDDQGHPRRWDSRSSHHISPGRLTSGPELELYDIRPFIVHFRVARAGTGGAGLVRCMTRRGRVAGSATRSWPWPSGALGLDLLLRLLPDVLTMSPRRPRSWQFSPACRCRSGSSSPTAAGGASACSPSGTTTSAALPPAPADRLVDEEVPDLFRRHRPGWVHHHAFSSARAAPCPVRLDAASRRSDACARPRLANRRPSART